jgi:hypothetical protein
MNLETYLDNSNTNKITDKILSTYKYFGYDKYDSRLFHMFFFDT